MWQVILGVAECILAVVVFLAITLASIWVATGEGGEEVDDHERAGEDSD